MSDARSDSPDSPDSLDPFDPDDWQALRAQGHRMLDDMFDYLQDLRARPVWQPIPAEKRALFRDALPRQPTALETVHASFMHDILPYAIGNAHPGFMGWVQGGGTPVGMLADMLAAGLNANVGGRDQMPLEVERQLVQWMRELFEFPATASGLFVTGSSMANLISVLVARTARLGIGVRRAGIAGVAGIAGAGDGDRATAGNRGAAQRADAAAPAATAATAAAVATASAAAAANGTTLCAYTSAAAHGCIAQAMDLAGIGIDALSVIAVDAEQRMDIAMLERAIARDRRDGLTPFFIAGTAGTVDTGAIDDLRALADIAARESIWFHVDGAYGALGMLASDIAPRLAGIERADSIAMDFHKWAQVQYDAGFVLVRDGAMHESTFAAPAAYLRRSTRGMAAGSPWPCDFGPDLSRSFKALKTWFTIKTYGAQRLGEVMSGTCALAQYLEQCILATPELELLAPVSLNIVCFGYRCPRTGWTERDRVDQHPADTDRRAASSTDGAQRDATRLDAERRTAERRSADRVESDRINGDIAIALQEAGRVAPSTTVVGGRLAIRAAFVNHRTGREDVDALVAATVHAGRKLTSP